MQRRFACLLLHPRQRQKHPDMGDEKSEFRRELEALLNKHSMENGSDTPDVIMADYLIVCLVAFDVASNLREKF